uniref:Cytochrome P450 704C1-like n=1 Tax=Tanacetum cinerariifolium TaxID=118510 RepID=A0A6L2JL99_TANCI|nr:cytochrome P450 704C1-like [Tanacetum cinerariifolium]
MRDLFGDGIFAVDGAKWRNQRKLASFEFSTKNLRDFSSDVFRSNSAKLAKKISLLAAAEETINLQDWLMKSTLDSIFKVGFGFDLDTLSGLNEASNQFMKAFDDANGLVFWRFVDLLWRVKRSLNIGGEAVLKENIKIIDNFVYDLIRDKREQMKIGNRDKEDILSRFLMESENDPENMNDKYLRDISLSFVIAGKDTSANTLTWFFYTLCKHPLIQEKVSEEVKTATEADNNTSIDEFGPKLTQVALDKMHYLHAALTETLRLYPAVPLDGKSAENDDILPDGLKIKKGDGLGYMAYPMGRMTYIWGDDAEEFRPERWLNNGVFQPESPFKFTAFQAGPRICLGKEFAYRQMKILAAILVYFFKFKLVDESKEATKYPTFRFVTPTHSEVYTADPVNVEYILKTNFANYTKGEYINNIMRDMIGSGIFAVDGEKWHHQRKLAGVEFATKALRDFSTLVFKSNTIKLSNKILLFADTDNIINMQVKRYLNVGYEAALKENIKTIDKFVYELIQNKINQMKNENIYKDKEDILSRFLIESESDPKNMNDKYIRDIILSLVFAGMETTADTLTWFFYMLCKNPLIQEKVAEEVKTVTEADNNTSIDEFGIKLTKVAIDKMHYLHATLTETLRLFPAIPMASKRAEKDDVLPDGFKIKKGDGVGYMAYTMGRMTYIWGDDAEEFRPERWLHNGVFLPETPFKFTAFQAGPRICIGKDFAYRQMKIMVAFLVYFFKFKLVDPSKKATYRVMFTLYMDKGLHLYATLLLVIVLAPYFKELIFSNHRPPIIGPISTLVIHFWELHDYMTSLARKYPTCRFIAPLNSEIYTVDPVNIEYILKTNFANYPKGEYHTGIVKDFFGNGIFVVDGAKWRHQRKLASFEFSTKVLRDFSTVIFRSNTAKLAKIIFLLAAAERTMDLQDLLMKSTLDLIFKVGFGFDLDTLSGLDEASNRFMKAFDDSNGLVYWRLADLLWRVKRYLNIGSEAALKKNITIIDNFLYELIQNKREQMKNGNIYRDKKDILSRFLMESENDPENMNDEYLRDITLNFVIAGKDTTANTLTWFFYILCKHPLIQEKIVEELKTATEADDHTSIDEFGLKLTEIALDRMHYLHAALSETLRLYPAVPLDGKSAEKDDVLPDGFKIKKGDGVAYMVYAMGRMTYIWGDDAEEFRPERWLNKGVFQPESPFKFTAFQGGPRICLGKDFAYRQMKILAAFLVYFFKFKLVDETKKATYRTMFTLHMDKGLHLYAFRRF